MVNSAVIFAILAFLVLALNLNADASESIPSVHLQNIVTYHLKCEGPCGLKEEIKNDQIIQLTYEGAVSKVTQDGRAETVIESSYDANAKMFKGAIILTSKDEQNVYHTSQCSGETATLPLVVNCRTQYPLVDDPKTEKITVEWTNYDLGKFVPN